MAGDAAEGGIDRIETVLSVLYSTVGGDGDGWRMDGQWMENGIRLQEY